MAEWADAVPATELFGQKEYPLLKRRSGRAQFLRSWATHRLSPYLRLHLGETRVPGIRSQMLKPHLRMRSDCLVGGDPGVTPVDEFDSPRGRLRAYGVRNSPTNSRSPTGSGSRKTYTDGDAGTVTAHGGGLSSRDGIKASTVAYTAFVTSGSSARIIIRPPVGSVYHRSVSNPRQHPNWWIPKLSAHALIGK